MAKGVDDLDQTYFSTRGPSAALSDDAVIDDFRKQID